MTWVYRRPFDFRPLKSPIFLLLAAASATSGACGLTLTPTSTLLGAGQLAGTCAITCTPAATVFSPGAAAGSTSSTFNVTGTLLAVAVIQGTAALAFDASAVPTSGNSYQVQSWPKPKRWYQGYAFNYAQLNNRLVFFPTTVPAGVAGQADIAFGASGVLKGVATIAGSASQQIQLSGAMVAAGNLAAVAPITFTPSAAITGTASGAVTGAIDQSLNLTGLLTAGGKLLGPSGLSFSLTANLGQTKLFDGLSVMTFEALGSLTGLEPLSEVGRILIRQKPAMISVLRKSNA